MHEEQLQLENLELTECYKKTDNSVFFYVSLNLLIVVNHVFENHCA